MEVDRANRFRDDLLAWADANLRTFPWRDQDASLYEVFVAEFFLTQTPAENVAKVYPKFLEEFPSLSDIADAREERLEAVIEPLGFQRMRSEALATIAAREDAVPETADELVELPRVGRYVANSTLCFALERPLPILDRNVVRAYDRVFGDEFPESESDGWEFASTMIPDDGSEARTYNLALLDFGALVCTAPEPNCERCFATNYCEYYEREVES